VDKKRRNFFVFGIVILLVGIYMLRANYRDCLYFFGYYWIAIIAMFITDMIAGRQEYKKIAAIGFIVVLAANIGALLYALPDEAYGAYGEEIQQRLEQEYTDVRISALNEDFPRYFSIGEESMFYKRPYVYVLEAREGVLVSVYDPFAKVMLTEVVVDDYQEGEEAFITALSRALEKTEEVK